MRGASLERASHGSLLDSLAFEALRDRGTTRCPTIPRQGSGRRVSVRLAVTRPVIAGGPLPSPERNSQATRNRETIGGPRAGTEPLVHPRLPRLSSRRVAWRIHESLAPFADSRSSRSEEGDPGERRHRARKTSKRTKVPANGISTMPNSGT